MDNLLNIDVGGDIKIDSFASGRDQYAFAQNGLTPNNGQADGSIFTIWIAVLRLV